MVGKVIQKGSREDSQKQLRKIGMASADREREKIKSSQNSAKMESSRRAHLNLSNYSNESSNGVMDRKIFAVKVWLT
jgi:hypothetical protein